VAAISGISLYPHLSARWQGWPAPAALFQAKPSTAPGSKPDPRPVRERLMNSHCGLRDSCLMARAIGTFKAQTRGRRKQDS
jgi:hypothetical protein